MCLLKNSKGEKTAPFLLKDEGLREAKGAREINRAVG